MDAEIARELENAIDVEPSAGFKGSSASASEEAHTEGLTVGTTAEETGHPLNSSNGKYSETQGWFDGQSKEHSPYDVITSDCFDRHPCRIIQDEHPEK